MSYFRFLGAILAAIVLCISSVSAQSSEGRILGTIRDSSGAVVAGAKVSVLNTETSFVRTLVTNSEGDYTAPSLEPGLYKVSVEASGFKTTTSDIFRLEVSREARIDMQLTPGTVSETVEVKAEAALTDTTDNTLNGVLDNKAINELPLNGRDFQNLLPLHPGVQRTPGGGFQSLTSNGNRPDDNNFYIDGADDNDVYYGESVMNDAGIQGTPASILPLDAIQEFNTQESPQADYGVKPGVVVNMGLKSGTNQIHGTAYEFIRNAAADARNYFDNPVEGQGRAPLILNEFGGSIGGPIKHDKLFYFFNYEGIRFKVGNTELVDTPITRSVAGDPVLVAKLADAGFAPEDVSIPDALAACAPACNPLSVRLATGGPNNSGLFPRNPGFTTNTSDPLLINYNFANTDRGDNVVAKMDYYLNPKNVISARFIYANTSLVEEDAFPLAQQWLSTTQPTTQIFGVNWVYTPNSTWVNELRFSYSRFNERINPGDTDMTAADYGLNTGVTDPRLNGLPRINADRHNFNYLGGNSSWPLWTYPTQTEVISDTVSRVSGKHNIRFGGEFRYGDVKYFRDTEGRGRVDFNSLEDFVAGHPHNWSLAYGDPGRNINLKSFGLFVQDGYRITPRVTINMGLRYDLTYPIADSQNRLANFDPSQGVIQVGQGISSAYPISRNNVSPRFGVAWDVFGTGRTVVRGGGGLIFEQPSIRTFLFSGGGLNLNPSGVMGVQPGTGNITAFFVSSTDPSVLNWNTSGPPIFPTAGQSSCSIDIPCFIFSTAPHLSTPYVANWNLNVQQAIGATGVLQVAYVANRGINLYSITDTNQPDPALSTPCIFATGGVFEGDFAGCEQKARPLTTACPPPVGLGTGGPCFKTLGQFQNLGNKASSNYNSLQVTFTKRYSHGLYLLAGYTYAHAIDTSTSNTAGEPQNSLNYADERGNSDFDIRHRFTLAVAYDLPSRESKFQLLTGWQVTTLATLQSGEPYTLFDSFDDISSTGEFADRWNITGSPKNIHWSPINAIPYTDNFEFDGGGNLTGDNQACINAVGSNPDAQQQLINFGCFFSPNGKTVLTPPIQGTFGNAGRNIFNGPGFVNWDFSVSKTFTLHERLKLQFRAEFFNILNHPNFDVFSLDNDLSDIHTAGLATFTPDLGSASNPVLGTGGSRHIQLGAKFSW